jgi:hypothetical protein
MGWGGGGMGMGMGMNPLMGGPAMDNMSMSNRGGPGFGPVMMVYGLNMKKFNCERLFNLLCLYGDVMKVSSAVQIFLTKGTVNLIILDFLFPKMLPSSKRVLQKNERIKSCRKNLRLPLFLHFSFIGWSVFSPGQVPEVEGRHGDGRNARPRGR